MGLRQFIIADQQRQDKTKALLAKVGFEAAHWTRVALYRDCFKFIENLGPENLDVLEISQSTVFKSRFNFKSFTGTTYPEFDICVDVLDKKFDLIIADQIFEHIKYPHRGAKNVYAMLRDGGHFIIATPFLIKVHRMPNDYSRWTEDGLAALLEEGGFDPAKIITRSWGNRACVTANFSSWALRGWRSLKNEPDLPVTVWAMAQK